MLSSHAGSSRYAPAGRSPDIGWPAGTPVSVADRLHFGRAAAAGGGVRAGQPAGAARDLAIALRCLARAVKGALRTPGSP
jgi:hypothetical protein